MTLPLIYAFQKADKKEVSAIKKKIKKGVKRKEIKEIISFAEKYEGILYAQKLQDKYAQKAKDALDAYPESEVKTSLLKFVDYVIERSM